MLADISTFESLVSSNRSASSQPVTETQDVAVANVQVSLATLGQLSGNTDLSYLVTVLRKTKKYDNADSFLENLTIRSSKEVSGLVEWIKQNLDIKDIPKQSPTIIQPIPTVSGPQDQRIVQERPVAAPTPAPVPKWRGPKVPFRVQGNPFNLPATASQQEWEKIEDALRWAIGQRKYKKDKARCKDTLRIVQYIREMQREAEGVGNVG